MSSALSLREFNRTRVSSQPSSPEEKKRASLSIIPGCSVGFLMKHFRQIVDDIEESVEIVDVVTDQLGTVGQFQALFLARLRRSVDRRVRTILIGLILMRR